MDRISITDAQFLSVPDLFPDEVENVIKLRVKTPYKKDRSHEILYATDLLLVDLGAINEDKIDTTKIETDCQLLAAAVSEYPQQLANALKALKKGSPEGIEEAYAAIKAVGLDEATVVSKGGGLVWLIAIAALCLTSCATNLNGCQAEKPKSDGSK